MMSMHFTDVSVCLTEPPVMRLNTVRVAAGSVEAACPFIFSDNNPGTCRPSAQRPDTSIQARLGQLPLPPIKNFVIPESRLNIHRDKELGHVSSSLSCYSLLQVEEIKVSCVFFF